MIQRVRLTVISVLAVLFLVAGATLDVIAAQYDRASDPHPHKVFMREAGWCWFQDPRAIIHQDKLIIGAVQGNGSGPALVGAYDLANSQSLGATVVHEKFDKDDHNSPVFHVRADGGLLTMYARHGRNNKHYYRLSSVDHPLEWGDEQVYTHGYLEGRNKVTYMNLYPMSQEGKLYNFFRGIEYNPSFITSKDDGHTWSHPTHFIRDHLQGRQRPYARYVGNGVDTVHVAFTDAHPRQYGNNIYYVAFRNGVFFRASGEPIRKLAASPLKPAEAELIYRGSEQYSTADRSSVPGGAWTSSIALDEQGHPHLGYSLHLNNNDHRYRLASWNGAEWIDREVAHAGHCLYPKESSYTGLITLDPGDPTTVLISTNVDPSTGEENGGRHEIYHARIGPEDDISTIEWTPLTENSPVRNLRPIIVRGGDYRVLMWLRGDFRNYTNYQLDAVGKVEKVQ